MNLDLWLRDGLFQKEVRDLWMKTILGLIVLFALILCISKLASSETIVETNTVTCELCHITVGMIEDFARQNSTIEEVIETVSKICPLLPEEDRLVCKPMIRQMAPVVIETILRREDPKKVCKQIGACPDED